MTLIDQRILIDAPTNIIWELISDPTEVAHWHTGYTRVSVLTTQQTGRGTRRRCSLAAGGRDVIEEITAWVEGMGYEYVMIEGGRLHAYQGRLRLRPGPDGTEVQWILDYQPRGPFGTLGNMLRGKRQMQNMMKDSLKMLRRRVDARGMRMDDEYRERVAMRERLNAEERVQYQPRYPTPVPDSTSTAEAAPEVEAAPAAEIPLPPELVPPPPAALTQPEAAPPPITPSPAVPQMPAPPPPPVLPSFVAQLTGNPPTESPASDAEHDTEPKPPPGIREALGSEPPSAQVPVTPTLAPPLVPDHQRKTPPRGIPSVQPSQAPTPVPAARTPVEPSPLDPEHDPNLPPPTPTTDTGEMSIWEVFGLKRPSDQDTENLHGLIEEAETRRKIEAVRATSGTTRRAVRVRQGHPGPGLRRRLQQKRVKVRLPKQKRREDAP